MFLSEYFTFDGIYSKEMYGATIVNTGEQLPRIVGSDLSIIEEESGMKKRPYYYGTKVNPISFQLQIGFRDENEIALKLDFKQRQEIIEWLSPFDDEYKQFSVSEDNTLIYYIKVTKFTWKEYVNGDLLTIDVRTDSGYAYSPIQNIYVNNIIETDTTIEISNYSNVDKFYKPIVEITKYGNVGDIITITNLDLNESIQLDGSLLKDESLQIDCDKKLIKSSTGLYRYDKITGFLRLKYGINRIRVQGKCEINMLLQFPMLLN